MFVWRRRHRPSSAPNKQTLSALLLLLLLFLNESHSFHASFLFSIPTKYHRLNPPIALSLSSSSNDKHTSPDITMSHSSAFIQLHKLLWSTLTFMGNRRLVNILRCLFPTYQDTIFYFAPKEKLVALTIDDGLSRGGSATSMTVQVLDLLARYNAHATFFVCCNYCIGDDAMKHVTRDLMHVHGHELGNHMAQDVSGYYSKLSIDEFRAEFEATNKVLEDLVNGEDGAAIDAAAQPYRIRWFRAPQGVYTTAMKQVLDQRNGSGSEPILHVLGDTYCDDWALACQDADFVYRTTMKQVHRGSILITHMPERNTEREAILHVFERILKDLESQGYRCVSLGEMWEVCEGPHVASNLSSGA